jgi:hypothetical protein
MLRQAQHEGEFLRLSDLFDRPEHEEIAIYSAALRAAAGLRTSAA